MIRSLVTHPFRPLCGRSRKWKGLVRLGFAWVFPESTSFLGGSGFLDLQEAEPDSYKKNLSWMIGRTDLQPPVNLAMDVLLGKNKSLPIVIGTLCLATASARSPLSCLGPAVLDLANRHANKQVQISALWLLV